MLQGVPQKETLLEDTWQYYYFKASSEKDLYIVLSPIIGDADLFVKMANDTESSLEN